MYIIFDIGGTSMRFAASKDGEKLSEPVILDTPQDFNEAVSRIEEIIKELSAGEKIEGVAGGIAGVLNKDEKSLFRSPHLEGWEGKPLAEKLGEQLLESYRSAERRRGGSPGVKEPSFEDGLPVFIKNDTDMIGLGEAILGAGKGAEIVVYITVSTGVGGTRIVNGEIDDYIYGFEPGHQIIITANNTGSEKVALPESRRSEATGVSGSRPIAPGVKEPYRTLEELISGSAIQKEYGKLPSTIEDPKVWDKTARDLALGLHNTIVHWSPNVVVLGGAMMLMTPGINIEKVKKYLNEIAKQIRIFPELPEIKLVELGHLGGLHGSLLYLKQHLK